MIPFDDALNELAKVNNMKNSCIDCEKPYDSFGIDMVLTYSQWALIMPAITGILCPQCISNRVSKIKGAIVIHAFIEFSPPNTDGQ